MNQYDILDTKSRTCTAFTESIDYKPLINVLR